MRVMKMGLREWGREERKREGGVNVDNREDSDGEKE